MAKAARLQIFARILLCLAAAARLGYWAACLRLSSSKAQEQSLVRNVSRGDKAQALVRFWEFVALLRAFQASLI
jgi:hypothetical protein